MPSTEESHEKTADWGSELAAIAESTAAVRSGITAIMRWISRHVVAHDALPIQLPLEISAPWTAVDDALDAIERTTKHARDRYVAHPLTRAARGERLSREEYYNLAAMGILSRGTRSPETADLDDFELFTMFCYEDADRRCYINPEKHPRGDSPRVRIRFGRPPEELDLSALRPEQHEFFRRLPDVYGRFHDSSGSKTERTS